MVEEWSGWSRRMLLDPGSCWMVEEWSGWYRRMLLDPGSVGWFRNGLAGIEGCYIYSTLALVGWFRNGLAGIEGCYTVPLFLVDG